MIFRNCRSASSMPAAVQRRHMSPDCQRFTLREVRRTISIIDSHGFVDCTLVIVTRPRSSQPLLHRRSVALGQVVEHIPLLVADTALDRHWAEHLVDRLAQCFGAVDHAEHALAEIEAAGDDVGEQLLGDGRVLGRAVPEPERQLHPVGADPERDDAAAALELDSVQHQHRQAQVVEAAAHQPDQVVARAGDELAAAREAAGGDAGQHLLEHMPAQGVTVGEVLVAAKRHLALAVGAAYPRPLDLDAPAAERHLTRCAPVAHGNALRVVLALRADDLVDLLLHQLGEHAEPDTDAQGEQPFLRRAHQLPERLLHPRRQHELADGLAPGDLIARYGLHGGSSSCRMDDFALATVATRPDKAGGPPPQVLRATGQPPFDRAQETGHVDSVVTSYRAHPPLLRVLSDDSKRAGSLFSLVEAVGDYALANRFKLPVRPPQTPRRAPLTRREKQVTSLLCQGFSNAAIASALSLEESTAKVHVSHILRKLGVRSRTEAAVLAAEEGLANSD